MLLVAFMAHPLAHLPKLRRPPESSRLPFGPGRLSFRAMGDFGAIRRAEGGLVRTGEGIHYAFYLSGASYGNKWLDWRIESRLVRINRRGRSMRLAKRRSERLGLLKVPVGGRPRPREIGFARSPGPGLYRYDLVFRNRRGRLLGRFHDYYSVVRRNTEIRLALNGSSFSAGARVSGKVENPGTEWAFYGVPFGIERFDGAAWVPIDWEAVFGHRAAFILIGIYGPPGTAGECVSGFTVPETMEPGLYRMTKRVGEEERSLTRRVDERELSAEFAIVPPGA